MPFQINMDEAKVPRYSLPPLLETQAGVRVGDAQAWRDVRRPEIVRCFEDNVYGRSPDRLPSVRVERRDDGSALEGKAIRRQIRLLFATEGGAAHLDLLLFLPSNSNPAPLFLGLNFFGNHTIHSDPGIQLPTTWVADEPGLGVTDHRAGEAGRGALAQCWPVETILARGYGLATVYCGDLDPDFDDGFQNGVHSLYRREGQRPDANEWGAVGAWAWGLSRALDVLETMPDVDAARVAVMGHSRLGKAALWAGARDERFGGVISNESGCGGAALSRRRFGETVERINTVFPHWFCRNFHKYNGREDELPIDQHQLLALIAPRPLYVASAQEDLWADPRGEFLSALHADPVYRLLGVQGLEAREIPPLESPILSRVGYHIRRGKHEITDYDWDCFLDFADRCLSGTEI